MKNKKWIAGITIMALAIVMFGLWQWPTRHKELPLFTDTEKYILGKLTTNQISKTFTPVLIYRLLPAIGGGDMVGSGTLFEGRNGRQVATAAHVFHQRYGESLFAIRKLRQLERGPAITDGIAMLNPETTNIPEFREAGTDIVVCMVTSGAIRPIRGFYDETRGKAEDQISFAFINRSQQLFITSIVSGERVRVIGAQAQTGNKPSLCLIVAASISGESGTGFVDVDNQLYVLKGRVEDTTSITAEIRARFGIPEHAPLSVAVGPLVLK